MNDAEILTAMTTLPGFAVLTAGNETVEPVVLQVHCFGYRPIAFRRDPCDDVHVLARHVRDVLASARIASIGVDGRGRGHAIGHALRAEGLTTHVFDGAEM